MCVCVYVCVFACVCDVSTPKSYTYHEYREYLLYIELIILRHAPLNNDVTYCFQINVRLRLIIAI